MCGSHTVEREQERERRRTSSDEVRPKQWGERENNARAYCCCCFCELLVCWRVGLRHLLGLQARAHNTLKAARWKRSLCTGLRTGPTRKEKDWQECMAGATRTARPATVVGVVAEAAAAASANAASGRLDSLFQSSRRAAHGRISCWQSYSFEHAENCKRFSSCIETTRTRACGSAKFNPKWILTMLQIISKRIDTMIDLTKTDGGKRSRSTRSS